MLFQNLPNKFYKKGTIYLYKCFEKIQAKSYKHYTAKFIATWKVLQVDDVGSRWYVIIYTIPEVYIQLSEHATIRTHIRERYHAITHTSHNTTLHPHITLGAAKHDEQRGGNTIFWQKGFRGKGRTQKYIIKYNIKHDDHVSLLDRGTDKMRQIPDEAGQNKTNSPSSYAERCVGWLYDWLQLASTLYYYYMCV